MAFIAFGTPAPDDEKTTDPQAPVEQHAPSVEESTHTTNEKED